MSSAITDARNAATVTTGAVTAVTRSSRLEAVSARRPPCEWSPACTTRAFTPRRLSSRPVAELTNFIASTPKRETNLAQPVCGCDVISITADPTESRVPAGRLRPLKSMSMYSWSPASAHRSRDCATRATARTLMILSCMSGWHVPSGVRLLPRVLQVSPTRPFAGCSSALSSTSRASIAGRRTISSRTPSSARRRSDDFQARFELRFRQVAHDFSSSVCRHVCEAWFAAPALTQGVQTARGLA